MLPSKGWLVIDIEVDGDPWDGELVAIGAADPDGKDVFAAVYPSIPEWLEQALADPDVGIVEHTLFDARWLRLHGVTVNGPIADTRLMAWNLDENTPRSLEFLAFHYLNHKMDKRIKQIKGEVRFKTKHGEYVRIREVPWTEMHEYNMDDIKTTAKLFNYLLKYQPEYWSRQIDLTGVLLDMECEGLPISESSLSRIRDELNSELADLEGFLKKKLPADFNLNSDDQVAALLFLDSFKLPARVRKGEYMPSTFEPEKEGRLWTKGNYVVKGYKLQPGEWTESGKRPKVDAKNLVAYSEHPWVKPYLQYQKASKLLGTYVDAFPRYTHDGRLYGQFNQTGTVTGRLSSSEPNLQNIPRRGEGGDRIRSIFEGDLVVADFSQLEPRLMAHFSEDPALLEVYTDGLDVYKQIARAVFDLDYDKVEPKHREISKTLMLGMSYGAKGRTIAEQLSLAGFPTKQRTASTYLAAMERRFARFFEWREEVIAEARATQKVTTLAGRKRHLNFVNDEWRVERQAVNSVIQGSAADIVNETMILVQEIPGIRILVQVHDELVCEHDGQPDLRAIQEAGETGHGFKLRVPLVFEPKACRNWQEGK